MVLITPIWLVVSVLVLCAVHLVVDVVRLRRHHDHLLPDTPRRPRG